MEQSLRWTRGLLLFYTVLGFFILPPIIRSVAVKQLSHQLDREVSIRQVKFNPDLWVLEFESPDLLPPFDGKIV